ncbi:MULTISPECIES: type II toxin-antitoxin system VapC family toxin [Bradyrhizobium]|uniref:type II toxin-antitoxin system VapC family toxin n=1 Tax=Bradyrhizobium TaxID=374 RepID=UPI000BEACCE2|nr:MULTISPECIES: type II toxin-antitoxin system VapC family toxin [Bradyrhizobium]MDA9452414.1 twitching motility protein PilT [Bradyrhizobium sp. CCBAU 21360]MDA9452971.1 twitching motility protein PilT [Bradyrhizobium sp. CCBAU 21359]MDA9512890.1 twitching motility protein PilT [Bradyrhizobium sp. CCBAU 11430]PDT71917.1 VapC toxin family PIN domain ribonuclease [Bradyrhizobium ottawaense]
MYLVDTNVISAASPNRPVSAAVVAWMDAQSGSLFLSAVTIAEIEDGIAKLRREKATRKSRDLTHWLDAVLHLYGDRILAFDVPTARIAGQLSDRARGQGHSPGFADIIIAATARQHALTVLSRNARHFVPLGVPVLDPFGELPPS